MQYNFKLADYIKKLREDNKIKLNNFAFKSGIEPSTLSRIENKKLELKISVLEKIAKAYNKTPAEFLKDFEEFNIQT